jgi:Family of unknown function (DUF6328)
MREGDRPLTSHPRGRSTTGPAVEGSSQGQPSTEATEQRRGERPETELERYDRNLTELLGELRIALPGVQVLFGFLLVIPFDARFKAASGAQRGLYFTTLVLTLLASMLLIAPTMLHRLQFRMGQKASIVMSSNRLAIAGLSVLALALTCAMAFITDFVFGAAAAVATGVVSALGFALLWYLLPLGRLRGRV